MSNDNTQNPVSRIGMLTATTLITLSQINANPNGIPNTQTRFAPNRVVLEQSCSLFRDFDSNAVAYVFYKPKDYFALYKKIAHSKWFVDVYKNASIGDELTIED